MGISQPLGTPDHVYFIVQVDYMWVIGRIQPELSTKSIEFELCSITKCCML